MPPCVLYEDDHLLVVHKPPGWNTHAPSPWAGQGLYEWLRDREPRWANLAIIHRLDKETSGVMVFSKSARANRSLTDQFATRRVTKRYVFWTDRPPSRRSWLARNTLIRSGSRQMAQPARTGQPLAETRFEVHPEPQIVQAIGPGAPSNLYKTYVWTGHAWPMSGRTHQIRAQAAAAGMPVLGDALYGGSPWVRLCLHAEELGFYHPVTNAFVRFTAPAEFHVWPGRLLRQALIEAEWTDAYRWIHGAADGWPGWYVDRLGNSFLSQSESDWSEALGTRLTQLGVSRDLPQTIYHKVLRRQLSRCTPGEAAPRCVQGPSMDQPVLIRENGLRFEIRLQEGYSVGLFLDQRENRRRLLTGYISHDFHLFDGRHPESRETLHVLNAFAYTCGFSVAAAQAGARVTSLDLSRRYLEWGRRNFQHNGIDPSMHLFVRGDVRDWLQRWERRAQHFHCILLDPPTFSRSKEGGVFQVKKDLPALVTVAARILRSHGVLFVSSNAADWPASDFVDTILRAVRVAGRQCARDHYVPQPPDFPVHAQEPAYLKTLWCRLD
ncbi:MAG: pseudouridine synthase [Verrucomicrobiota bacterium]|nr:pseudouridine synthase [Limisphaera sp.]MDW8381296.1 pseudouridine synthase [Verrucomicrobiota bacterium]